MKKRLCIVTGTRAEYHLLYPLLRTLERDGRLEYFLAVTGSHLSERYGNTYKDIEKDGFRDFERIPILEDTDGPDAINRAMARAIIGFSDCFDRRLPDMVVLLGDRYELLAVAAAAMNHQIPIAHLFGGETTEGAIDECIRHAITKMSYLHFTSCETYRKRVIQLGESPERVFNVGAIGLENIRNVKRMTRDELADSLGFDLSGQFAVVTFHPVTLEKGTEGREFGEILKAFTQFPDLKFIFTKANADSGGMCINDMIDHFVGEYPEKATAVFSLGMVRYLSALENASMVIGNSSSGIMETPSFRVPTVNIGDRQRGRIQAKNIINCPPEEEAVREAMEKALSDDFREYITDTVNPYGDGIVTPKIVEQIERFLERGIDLKKSFYDIDFQ